MGVLTSGTFLLQEQDMDHVDLPPDDMDEDCGWDVDTPKLTINGLPEHLIFENLNSDTTNMHSESGRISKIKYSKTRNKRSA